MLVEQGVLAWDDRRLYLAGSVSVSGCVRIGIGSPNTGKNEYRLIMPGVETWSLEGINIYQKMYVRKIVAGSYFNE